MNHSTYYGCNIHRNTTPSTLRWGTYVRDTFMYADTLTGIRELIRNHN